MLHLQRPVNLWLVQVYQAVRHVVQKRIGATSVRVSAKSIAMPLWIFVLCTMPASIPRNTKAWAGLNATCFGHGGLARIGRIPADHSALLQQLVCGLSISFVLTIVKNHHLAHNPSGFVLWLLGGRLLTARVNSLLARKVSGRAGKFHGGATALQCRAESVTRG